MVEVGPARRAIRALLVFSRSVTSPFSVVVSPREKQNCHRLQLRSRRPRPVLSCRDAWELGGAGETMSSWTAQREQPALPEFVDA
jgi:hypothetical protein